ncbi:enhancer of mRNA-decapping protein 4-like isoform X2 [Lineus longissimus]|uniref:enhancer of mRNA-decapping protein 4-like isoform X2 n=1 Tax=Lineus longissimus TaxID=88925 RepID=UPI00315D15B2
MDSSSSSLSSTEHAEASQLLKNILNVGKSASSTRDQGLPGYPVKMNGTPAASASYDSNSPLNNSTTSRPHNIEDFIKSLNASSSTKQQILLQGSDSASSFGVYGQEVEIISSTASGSTQPSAGSNKVKIIPAVNYEWENRYYLGNLVASHKSGLYIAYVLKGKSGGVVRITNRKTAQRSLLKGFAGLVSDIAFAYLPEVILAVVDGIGNLHVYSIDESKNAAIQVNVIVQVNRAPGAAPAVDHRVIWCPYIPEEEDEAEDDPPDDVGKLLVLTHDNCAEMFNIDMILKEHAEVTLSTTDIRVGYLAVENHEKAIVDAAFSPDGTALATASLDGEVRVFQVYMHDNTQPRCLHNWKPHGGKPLSFLKFLDDHKEPKSQFWKFALTGADQNRELKIWSCESWSCLQTLRFFPPPHTLNNEEVEPCLKASVDLTSKYVVLSDIKRRVLYVLFIHQDWEVGRAHVSSISEFLLAQPCLSFSILEAGIKKFKKTIEGGHMSEFSPAHSEEDEDDVKEDELVVGVMVKMYAVHTKALQELMIQFQPESSIPSHALSTSFVSSVSQDEAGFRDALTDVSMDTVSDADRSHESSKPYLLTPDAFTTSPRKYADQAALDSFRSSLTSSTSSFTQVTAMADGSSSFMDPTLQSPGSSITLTPTSVTHDPREVLQTSTPTQTSLVQDVPLPPSTPGEDELNSSRSSSIFNTPIMAGVSSPRSAQSPLGSSSLIDLQPSPMSKPSDFMSPRSTGSSETSLKASSTVKTIDLLASTGAVNGPLATSETVDDMFSKDDASSRGSQTPRKKLQSMGSSSSTSMEVSDILSLSRRTDEGSGGSGEETAPVVTNDLIGDISPAYISAESKDYSGDDEKGKKAYDATIWPKAPDVSNEAKRLAVEALTKSGVAGYDVVTDAVPWSPDDDQAKPDGEGPLEEALACSGAAPEDLSDDGEDQDDGDDVQVEEEEDLKEGEGEHTPAPGSEYSEREETASLSSSMESARKRLHQTPVTVHSTIGSGDGPQVIGVDPTALNQVQISIGEVMSMLQIQQTQIEALQQEIGRQQSGRDVLSGVKNEMGNLQGSISGHLNQRLDDHTQQQQNILRDAISERQQSDRQKNERLSQQVTNAVTGKIDKAIKAEMKNTVVPIVQKTLDPIKDQLHNEMAQKLTAADALMKDNISKLVRSKQTIDSIGQAAASAIQGPLNATYRESFQNTVIPGFERATQNLFRQLNDTFQKGTKDYIQQLESQLEKIQRKQQSARDPFMSQLQTSLDTFQTTAEQLQESVMGCVKKEIERHVYGSVNRIQDQLSNQVRDIVKHELEAAMKEQQESLNLSLMSAVRSNAVTPVPTSPDPQQLQSHILHLLQQGQLNVAFQQALSASDLNLVMFVCDTVNPTQVFEQEPCPLQQPVLLSLIQQLSADLGNHTELKHKYLEEAVMNLDTTNALTKEHMPNVLGSLIHKLTNFITVHPSDKMTRPMKMLLMASQSLLK